MPSIFDAVDVAARLPDIQFPEFTAKLITDTFDALVSANLRQTESYIELVGAISKTITTYINDTQDDITTHVLYCEATGKPYKITPQELKFYRRMCVPVPRRCPDQRQRDRVALRNPHRLWTRPCMQCSKPMQTTYSPDRPEIVHCEECYLKDIY